VESGGVQPDYVGERKVLGQRLMSIFGTKKRAEACSDDEGRMNPFLRFSSMNSVTASSFGLRQNGFCAFGTKSGFRSIAWLYFLWLGVFLLVVQKRLWE